MFLPFEHSEKLEDQQVGGGAGGGRHRWGPAGGAPGAPCPPRAAQENVRLNQGLLRQCQAAGYDELAAMLENHVKAAIAHEQVVAKWGRFPHRNAILGRESTAAEAAGLADRSIAGF